MGAKSWIKHLIIVIIIILFFSITRIAGLVTDYWWFKSVGFSKIFLISLQAKLAVFALATLLFFVFITANLWISTKLNKPSGKPRIAFRTKALIALAVSLFAGLASYHGWFTALRHMNQVPFNITDPIFLKDVAFYVFSLPFITFMWSVIMWCVLITAALVITDYMQSFIIGAMKQGRTGIESQGIPGQAPPQQNITLKSVFADVKKHAFIHMGVLGSLFFLLLAVNHYISRFSIMYSESGAVVGASYTDVNVLLPVITFLMGFAAVIAVLFYWWIFKVTRQPKLRKRHILAYAVAIYLVVFIIGPTVLPAAVQSLKVSPNEINLEKPYIKHNINFTNIAYGLSDVEEREHPVEQKLNPEVLARSRDTLDNVRLLDWRPLTQTYKQTQEIRLYYDLSGIDIDRYNISGDYTEVMLAPREMDHDQIPAEARTWVNMHMIYTHGYGLVMSPVNNVTDEGLPRYLIKDVPPVLHTDDESLKIERPQIYYGGTENRYVITNTGTDEFDYPKGDANEYTNYAGKGGVVLDSFLKKLFMAIRFGDIKILLSTDITEESRMMFARNVQERISKITPFLKLDDDPYIVINDGKLYWIQDAYTTTSRFPYSEKLNKAVNSEREDINYARNSVKIVVDAYHGSVSYYVADPEDPMILTYARIFPQQFKSLKTMPEGLKDHIRYPEWLFKIQSSIYSDYHMNDPVVFYNKEDAWEIPKEIYGTGQQIRVEPYYIIMKLPDEEKEEFVLLMPFTPIRKDNMISWLAARSDGDDYGKLFLYKFPKDKLIYGPSQVEATFDQDSEISQQLTLWSQRGSGVIRGNLLVIPIEESVIYIEPLYLQAEQGQLPQMKRVLVSDGERVVMEKNLDTALEVLFGKAPEGSGGAGIEEGDERKAPEYDLIQQAQDHYDAILDAMQENDWESFGTSFRKLGDALERISD
ncbi:MAG: UPF0182 family protein [Candidatus Woesearchaeota archaeon]